MKTTYEFVLETLDYYPDCGDDPDIIDTCGYNTLEEAIASAKRCDGPWRIALRRDVGNDVEGLIDRNYAYPDADGKLPEDFVDGPRVPKRFRDLVLPHRGPVTRKFTVVK